MKWARLRTGPVFDDFDECTYGIQPGQQGSSENGHGHNSQLDATSSIPVAMTSHILHTHLIYVKVVHVCQCLL